tara:strand:- start:368 stop:541 length:174 start_codon:yes stop_codon:yes gene_type:complete
VAQELHKQVVLVVQVAEVIEVELGVQQLQDKVMQVVTLLQLMQKLAVVEEQVRQVKV